MDDHRMPCERVDMLERRIVALQASGKESGDLLGVPHHAETRDQRLTNQLLAVVSELIETMADALFNNRATAPKCVHHASAALLACAREAEESADAELVETNEQRMYRGGLAPWQVRSVTTYIDANLSASISCEELARSTRLSVSYFARAFKCTFGFPPHVFVMRRRMERAQGLMLKTHAPLAQIALDCGLSDQAHLSRLFLRFTGERPASWRRARASGINPKT
jgi:AraC family transcriptional regulator